MSEEFVLYHDQYVRKEDAAIDMEDRGYNFGDGIYEVVFVYSGKSFAMNEHFERFISSAAKLEMQLPFDAPRFVELTEGLIEKNSLRDGMVYVQMTRGASPRNHLYERDMKCLVTGFTREMKPPEQLHQDGIRVYLTDDIRWLRCDIKSLNLLGNTMAKRQAADHNCQEAILHRDGTCTEGSSSNLYIVKDSVLQTHPANNLILNGITRQAILKIAHEKGIEVKEEPFTVKDLAAADEVFISSTTMEVTPVIQAAGQLDAEYQIGSITRSLQNGLKKKIYGSEFIESI
ncbi:D-amino-acid transaminase [Fictibacillus aquaticus]|uniref:D-alanine aminotransferase n=1 Tax=Fictibacillus aquaticus TaxID=2021314 RepID=A0A235FCI5_9BACL|nr:D-amino-acid transaminase [Fictibacillus aquaticus]OYD58667.1 D-amino-acid transaminase [Fictibacillus aquaticus]